MPEYYRLARLYRRACTLLVCLELVYTFAYVLVILMCLTASVLIYIPVNTQRALSKKQ